MQLCKGRFKVLLKLKSATFTSPHIQLILMERKQRFEKVEMFLTAIGVMYLFLVKLERPRKNESHLDNDKRQEHFINAGHFH